MKFALFALLAVTASYTTCVYGHKCGNVTAVELELETKCRKELPTHHGAFYMMAAVVVFMNLVFLAASIYLFVFILKTVTKAVVDAEEKAHQLMDAVLVVLLPDEVMKTIENGANGNHAKKN